MSGHIRRHPVFVAEAGDTIVGVLALETAPGPEISRAIPVVVR